MAEKLTIAQPITVRFSVEGRKRVEALAESNAMEVSEYIRHLVALDEVAQKRKWSALNAVFSTGSNESTSTADDGANHEPLTISKWGAL